MLDKLKIATTDVLFSRDTRLAITCRSDSVGIPLPFDDGTVALVSKAEYRDELLSIYFQRGWLSAEFSPTRMHSGGAHNLRPPTSATELQAVLDEVSARAAEWGVHFSIQDAMVIRADLFRDVCPEFDFENYRPILKSVSFRSNRCWEHGSTVYVGNKSTLIMAYDKLAEMRDKGTVIPDNVPPRLVRFEAQLRKACAVQRHLKCTTVSDILRNFDGIGNSYREFIQERLGETSDPEFTGRAVSIFVEDFSILVDPREKGAARSFLEAVGAVGIHRAGCSAVQFQNLLRSAGMSRNQARRQVNLLRRVQDRLPMGSSRVTYGDLRAELLRQLLA